MSQSLFSTSWFEIITLYLRRPRFTLDIQTEAFWSLENTSLSQQNMDLRLSHFSHNNSTMKPKAEPTLFILGGLPPTSP